MKSPHRIVACVVGVLVCHVLFVWSQGKSLDARGGGALNRAERSRAVRQTSTMRAYSEADFQEYLRRWRVDEGIEKERAPGVRWKRGR